MTLDERISCILREPIEAEPGEVETDCFDPMEGPYRLWDNLISGPTISIRNLKQMSHQQFVNALNRAWNDGKRYGGSR